MRPESTNATSINRIITQQASFRCQLPGHYRHPRRTSPLGRVAGQKFSTAKIFGVKLFQLLCAAVWVRPCLYRDSVNLGREPINRVVISSHHRSPKGPKELTFSIPD